MIVLTILIPIIYTLIILFFVKGFNQVKSFISYEKATKIRFTIIIPFRNEALNLPNLLHSISLLQYPKSKFEILMINDESIDEFESIIQNFKLKNSDIDISVLQNERKSNSPKKDAISLGVKMSKYEWILTTDADCELPAKWLKTYDGFIQKESPKMIVGPVTFKTEDKFLFNFQTLDLLSLQGSTIGGFGIKKPFLCNGANLCYHKITFDKLDGFKGNDSVASGDDIFLLEKMVNQFPDQVHYLKSTQAIVQTKPENNFKDLVQQRIRWASKTSSYHNSFGKFIGIIVFMTNLLLVILLIMAVFHKVSWQYFGFIFLLKFNVDFVLLYKTATFFDQQSVLKHYFISSLIHPFFIVYVAILSLNRSYQWKGRKFNK